MKPDSDSYYLTEGGLRKLQQEFKELKEVKRPKAVERLATARGFGDLTENSEYSAASEDLLFLDERISELDHILKNVTILNSPQKHDVVQLGSTVIVKADGDEDEFTIVGTLEADPFRGKISNESPVGKALLGHKIGDVVTVSSTIKATYKIVRIK